MRQMAVGDTLLSNNVACSSLMRSQSSALNIVIALLANANELLPNSWEHKSFTFSDAQSVWMVAYVMLSLLRCRKHDGIKFRLDSQLQVICSACYIGNLIKLTHK